MKVVKGREREEEGSRPERPVVKAHRISCSVTNNLLSLSVVSRS